MITKFLLFSDKVTSGPENELIMFPFVPGSGFPAWHFEFLPSLRNNYLALWEPLELWLKIQRRNRPRWPTHTDTMRSFLFVSLFFIYFLFWSNKGSVQLLCCSCFIVGFWKRRGREKNPVQLFLGPQEKTKKSIWWMRSNFKFNIFDIWVFVSGEAFQKLTSAHPWDIQVPPA